MISDIRTSLVDWPDHVCHTIFTRGCNLKCPFCYNWRLFEENNPPDFGIDNCMNYLIRNRHKTKYVCITGGEPAIHDDLAELIVSLKEKGFFVKLDTNGLEPFIGILRPFLDYVSIDLKSLLAYYGRLDIENNFPNKDYKDRFYRTITSLLHPHLEIRSTMVPGLMYKEYLLSQIDLLRKANSFTIQQFHPESSYDLRYRSIKPFSESYLKDISLSLKDAGLGIPINIIF